MRLHRGENQTVIREQPELLAEDNGCGQDAACNGQNLNMPLQNFLRREPEDRGF